jgi:hypothetical protein
MQTGASQIELEALCDLRNDGSLEILVTSVLGSSE